MSQPTPTTPDAPIPSRPRSGGPKTPEGKARSRGNALKHGLRARVLVPEEMAREIESRTVQFRREFRPRTAYQAWLVGQIARETVRIDRCAELDLADLQRRIDHDGPCWDQERQRAIAALADRLRRQPGRVLPALEADRHGIDWLLMRWEALAEVLANGNDWDEDQRRLALDLLGVPVELRTGRDGLPELARLPAFVQSKIQRLRDLQASGSNDQDQARRSLTELGLSAAGEPISGPLRRYEQSCRRALAWARDELRRQQVKLTGLFDFPDFNGDGNLDDVAPDPLEVPAPAPEPMPAPLPATAPEPSRSAILEPLRKRLMAAGMDSRDLDLEQGWLDEVLPGPRDYFELDLAMAGPPSANGHATPARRPGVKGRP